MAASEAPTFGEARRGYIPAEVDACIDDLSGKIEAAERRVGELEQRLADAEDAEEAVKQTYVTAQRTKDQVVGGAESEAEQLVTEARRKAYETITAAKAEADEIITAAITEAEETLTEARSAAEATISDARREASSIMSEIEEAGARLTAETEAAGTDARVHAEMESRELLQRIARLGLVASDLEHRFGSMNRGALGEIVHIRDLAEALVGAGTDRPAAPEHHGERARPKEKEAEASVAAPT